MFAAIATVGIVYGSLWFPRQAVRIGAFLFGLELWKEKQKNTDFEQLFKMKFGVDISRVVKKVRKQGDAKRDEDFDEEPPPFYIFTIEAADDPRLEFFVGKRFALTEEETFLFQKGIEAIKAGEYPAVDFTWLETLSEARLEETAENAK